MIVVAGFPIGSNDIGWGFGFFCHGFTAILYLLIAQCDYFMPTIQKEQSIPYLAADMYRLVADIAAYPDFVPYCSGTIIHESSDRCVEASVSLNFYGVKQTFTTKNQMQPDSIITMELVNGPIKHLQGQWQFVALGEAASKITLSVDYSIDHPWYGALFDAAVGRVSSEILQAFVLRAKVLYGT